MQQYQNSCIITPITHCIANWSMTQVARSGIRALILANNLAWLKLFFSSSGSLHPLVSVFAVRRRPSLVLLIRMLWMDMPFTGYPMQNKVSSVQHELQQENVLALNVFHLKYTFIIFLIFNINIKYKYLQNISLKIFKDDLAIKTCSFLSLSQACVKTNKLNGQKEYMQV